MFLLLFAVPLIAQSLAAESASDFLDLGARVKPLPTSNRFEEPGYFVWCGSPIKTADGRYHLFYSRWPLSVGFHPGWALRSEVAHAVADQAAGPYHFSDLTLPARGGAFWDGAATHNPVVIQVGKRLALFYTGNAGDGKTYPMHRNNQRVGVALADRPEGPWTRLDHPVIDASSDPQAFDALCVTNPAVCVRPDGTLLMLYKGVARKEGVLMGGNVLYGAAVAKSPEGPWTKVPSHVFQPPKEDNQKHWMMAEDAFMWFSAKYGNRYYAVARDVVGAFSGAKGGIALFQSEDGLDWKPAAHPKVVGNRISTADGGSIGRIERPVILMEDGEPFLLFGAANGYSKKSWNVQIPLR